MHITLQFAISACNLPKVFDPQQDKQLSVDILGVVVRANLLILAAIIATVVSMLFILAMCWSRKSSSCCKRKVTKNNVSTPKRVAIF